MAAKKRRKSTKKSRAAAARRSPWIKAGKACKGKKNFKTCRRKKFASLKRKSKR